MMGGLINVTSMILPDYTRPSLQVSYKLKFSYSEMQLLVWLLPWISSTLFAADLVLELCVLHDFHRRHRDRFEVPKAAKLKVKAAELIALKRVLTAPVLPSEWDIDRNSLLAKIDQLTVGIK